MEFVPTIGYLVLAPLLLLLAIIFYLNPPKKKNPYYGYRTKRSMSSEEAWAKGNALCNRWFLFLAMGLNLVQVVVFKACDLTTAILVMTGLIVVSLPVMILLIEQELKADGHGS